MTRLATKQKKYLRGLAHTLTPAVYVGHKGVTDNLVAEVETALNAHELIKIRFNDFKGRGAKKEITAVLTQKTHAQLVGMIGHMVILFRPHQDKTQRKVQIP